MREGGDDTLAERMSIASVEIANVAHGGDRQPGFRVEVKLLIELDARVNPIKLTSRM